MARIRARQNELVAGRGNAHPARSHDFRWGRRSSSAWPADTPGGRLLRAGSASEYSAIKPWNVRGCSGDRLNSRRGRRAARRKAASRYSGLTFLCIPQPQPPSQHSRRHFPTTLTSSYFVWWSQIGHIAHGIDRLEVRVAGDAASRLRPCVPVPAAAPRPSCRWAGVRADRERRGGVRAERGSAGGQGNWAR